MGIDQVAGSDALQEFEPDHNLDLVLKLPPNIKHPFISIITRDILRLR